MRKQWQLVTEMSNRMESEQELFSMDSNDSEDAVGSSIVIRPISYS